MRGARPSSVAWHPDSLPPCPTAGCSCPCDPGMKVFGTVTLEFQVERDPCRSATSLSNGILSPGSWATDPSPKPRISLLAFDSTSAPPPPQADQGGPISPWTPLDPRRQHVPSCVAHSHVSTFGRWHFRVSPSSFPNTAVKSQGKLRGGLGLARGREICTQTPEGGVVIRAPPLQTSGGSRGIPGPAFLVCPRPLGHRCLPVPCTPTPTVSTLASPPSAP